MTDETAKAAMLTGVHVGDVIGERYCVETVLGAGAMGVVVAARHIELDDPVAIKFLALDLLDNPNALGRFHREARAAARIKHEHVIRVYDVGKLANGVPYLVMERLAGSDLATLLNDEGPLPLADSLRFVREACAGIAEAHRLGIVHRDIKPSNLFCVRHPNARRSVKVLDFGISKLIEPAPDGSITGTASLLGSPSYMSPEQMRAPNRVDHRTDVWSLGVVLYELTTGGLPFGGSSYAELCLSVTSDTPHPPRWRCPELPVELEAIVLKCLRKNRDERYASCDELARALETFASAQHGAYKPGATTANAGSPPTLTASPDWAPAPLALQASSVGKSTWARTVRPLATLGRGYQVALAALGGAFLLGLGLVWWSAARSVPAVASAVRQPDLPALPTPATPVVTKPEPIAPSPAPASSNTAGAPLERAPVPPGSVSIRALGTAPPAAQPLAPPRPHTPPPATQPRAAAPASPAKPPPAKPPQTAKPPTAIPVQRSQSEVWTKRE